MNFENNVNSFFMKDKGLVSTSEDPGFIAAHLASRANRKNDYVLLEMVTNKGVSLCRKNKQSDSVQSFEQERLLPTNVVFAVHNQKVKTIQTSSDREKLLRSKHFSVGRTVKKRLLTVELVDTDLLE